MAAKPLKDPNIRSRTAFIDNSIPGVFNPIPWHLVEYDFQGTGKGSGVKPLWEMVDIDNGSKSRETNKVVTAVQFVDPSNLFVQRISPGNEYDKNRSGVNGGPAPRHPSRTL